MGEVTFQQRCEAISSELKHLKLSVALHWEGPYRDISPVGRGRGVYAWVQRQGDGDRLIRIGAAGDLQRRLAEYGSEIFNERPDVVVFVASVPDNCQSATRTRSLRQRWDDWCHDVARPL